MSKKIEEIENFEEQGFENLYEYWSETHLNGIAYLGSYKRSYPDAIHVTTTGSAFLTLEVTSGDEISASIDLRENDRLMQRKTLEKGKDKDVINKLSEMGEDEAGEMIEEAYDKAEFIRPDLKKRPLSMRMKEAVREGVHRTNCPECGYEVRGEPDATQVYCEHCDKKVKISSVV